MAWDSESEDSSAEEEQTTSAISYILITIDCDKSMFQKKDGNDCAFKIVLKSCYEILEQQLMKGGKRGVNPVAIALVSDDIDEMYLCDFKDNVPASVKKFHSIGLKENLLSLLIYRGTRASFYPFHNHGNYFEVIEKRYIKHQKFGNNVSVTKDTNTEVKTIIRGGEAKDTYSLQYCKLKDPLSFTSEERENLVYDGLHSTDPTFIQRNRRRNCPHFDIFWQYCVDRDSNLICARKYKADGPTKLVQLTPKLVNGVRSFLVRGIPYSSDIHYQDIHNPLYSAYSTDNKAISEAAEKKWEYVRAELLDESARSVVDVLELNMIEKDVSDVVKEFQDLTLITGTKRKAASKPKTTNKKK
ncbi:putative telomeric DNA binding protein [Trypoxylus dichotomus]